MRTYVAFTAAALAASVASCKGKPTHQAPPENSATPTSGTGSAASRTAPDIELPHSDGSPLKPTTARLTEAQLHRLQDMQFPGFASRGHGFDAANGMMEVQEKTPDHPTIWAVITVAPCDSPVKVLPACLPMVGDQWKKDPRLAELRADMPQQLQAATDTVFEVNQTQVGTTPMIYRYQLGEAIAKPSPPGTPEGSGFSPGGVAFSHAYFVYYNDGVNQIRVLAEYKDSAMVSKEKMAERVPRADLENVAKGFMDVYVHEWSKP